VNQNIVTKNAIESSIPFMLSFLALIIQSNILPVLVIGFVLNGVASFQTVSFCSYSNNNSS